MALLKDMIQYLKTSGLVIGDGDDAFRDFLPEAPDNLVSLYEYKGDPVSPYTDVVHRSVQVIVRNQSATAAKKLSDDIFKAFCRYDENQRLDLTPTRWGQIHIRSTPYKLSQDDRDRTKYVFNLGITTTTD